MNESSRESFGRTQDGEPVERFVLERDGLRATLTNFGATLLGLEVPDRHGARADIVLGFDTLAEYESPSNPYFGGLVGRCANRIAGARFDLDGREVRLEANEGRHHLHGGRRGFDRRAWAAHFDHDGASVSFTRSSPAGEEGYPGAVALRATYHLEPDGVLRLETEASCDIATVLNLTQHSYFNLAGSGSVTEHELEVRAARFVAVDGELIPTGELRAVQGTPFDLRAPRRLGDCLDALANSAMGGLDLCYAFDEGRTKTPRTVCRLSDARSGRVLEVATTQPGLQVYTANRLQDLPGKHGQIYRRHGGVCLEAQHWPDAPHHAHFPTIVLRPGERQREVTRWTFSTLR